MEGVRRSGGDVHPVRGVAQLVWPPHLLCGLRRSQSRCDGAKAARIAGGVDLASVALAHSRRTGTALSRTTPA
jgi:hypothetical protein